MVGVPPARDRLPDRRRLYVLAPALVPGFAIALYWICSLAQGDSLSVAAVYRYGDYQYFPLLAGLARFSLGESLVFEHLGEGICSFPLPVLVLHGLLIGLLGPIGFAVADVATASFTYFAARRCLRACALFPLTCEVLALLVACTVLVLPARGGAEQWMPDLLLSGYRVPRPFVNDVFRLLTVGSWLRIFVGGQRETREWLWLGVWFGLLLQSRFYTGATLGLAIGIAVLLQSLSERRRLGETLRGVGALALTTAVTLLPFLAQRLIEHPDVPVRFGTFPVRRLDPLWIEGRYGEVLQALGVALLAGLSLRRAQLPGREMRLRALGALVLLCPLSFLALPASTLLLGRTVQLYQFGGEVAVFKTLAIVVCLGQLADVAARALALRAPRATSRPWLRLAALGLAAVVGIAVSSDRHGATLAMRRHVRADFASYRVREYRSAFAALTQELGSERYRDARVLATLDIQVHAWWSLFGGGQAFLPDPFATGVPDEEIEDRLLAFLRLNGLEATAARRMLHDSALLIFFLSCAKYQASPAYTFSTLDDYPAGVRHRLRSMNAFASWSVALPNSEARRLMEKYYRTADSEGGRRLDVIVLGRGRFDGSLEPNPARFERSYQNRVFRVYSRRAR